MRKILLFVLMGSLCSVVSGQQNFFTDAGVDRQLQTNGNRVIFPEKYRAYSLDVPGLKTFLWTLPSELSLGSNRNQAPVLELPMPDGQMARFRVWESSVMDPALAAKFPEIRTFLGQGIDDPYATVRFDYNPYFGFSGQILSVVSGRILIDPYARGDKNNCISYYSRDAKLTQPFICDFSEKPSFSESISAGPCRGTQLVTYRLALACTGEYAVAVAGPSPTIPAVLAAMNTAVARVTGVYEQEVSVRLILVANNDLLIFLDASTDPYTNNNGSTMLGENQSTIDAFIGTANYDIGHVFSTGGGGVASLGVVCRSGLKARGVTGLTNPVGDPFYIDYVAHEMGHQYGGRHTFNSTVSQCGGGNRSASTAYEVGSGTTIMGYAGICGTDNIQPNSDPFFHTVSFDEIGNYITTGLGNCPIPTATGNTLPVITAMNNNGANIPLNTPFTLSGSATDANSDALTYDWEEWDLGPATTWNGGNANTSSPLFKSRIPKTVGERTFPDMAVILAGYPANPPAIMGGLKGETLPTQARILNFRLTVRDNRAGGGGVVTAGDGCQAGFSGFFQINTIAGTGPFIVAVPNGGENLAGGSSQTVTWNPAGTDLAPISTANVKISLSTDGGLTYPTVLLASTPNDGSESVAIPLITTSTARVKIEAIGNIFFDISDNNFTIAAPGVGFSFDNPAPAVSACPAGATMSITLGTTSSGGFSNPITLSAIAGVPAGTNVTFGTNPLTPGNSSVVTLNNTNILSAGSYVITIRGTATGAATQTRDITYTISPGTAPVITVQPANQELCAGENTSFSITSATATGFQWQLSTNGGGTFNNIANGGVYSGVTTSTLTITGATAGMNTYQYRGIAIGQCGSTTSTAGILIVHQVPTIGLSAVPLTSLQPGQTTTLTATPSSSTGGVLTTTWFYNTATISHIGNTKVIGVDSIGTYQVSIQEVWPSTLVCSSLSPVVSIIAPASTKLFVFPSPNDGRFTVSYYNSGGASLTRTIVIYDSKGSRVFNKTFNISGLYTLLNINIRPAQSGVYHIVVGDALGKKLIVGKLLVHQ